MPFPFDNTYARLPETFAIPVEPSPVGDPSLIALNRELAAELGADPDFLESGDGLAILSGNKIPEGAQPVAMAYAGHQFGGFVPQLGDGRALLLGEVIDSNGVRRDMQLKGSGPTPFSRRGDGRSALGPVLREYIVSEAMHALGVPTTRALAAIATGDKVVREGMIPGGVFTRVARSHVRIGTFQFFASRGQEENVKILADYVIDRHYPEAREADNPYLALLEAVLQKQADLVAHWMQIGFIHGVMNTDNMSVAGETIDYGPCAFLDEYNPGKKFSSIDRHGRYAFANQAPIALWNLTRFAETLIPLLDEDEKKALASAESALSKFPETHGEAFRDRFAAKIGISDPSKDDWALVESLLETMLEGEADFTLTFRHLSDALENGDDDPVLLQVDQPEPIKQWLEKWRARMESTDLDAALRLMRKSNPIFIPRNHRIEEVIEAAYGGDYGPFHRMNEVLQEPFTLQPEFQEYEQAPKPDEVVRATFCGT